MNLSASLGGRLHRQPYIVTLICVVAPESTHQVSIGAKLKLTSEQTKVRIIPFFAR